MHSVQLRRGLQQLLLVSHIVSVCHITSEEVYQSSVGHGWSTV